MIVVSNKAQPTETSQPGNGKDKSPAGKLIMIPRPGSCKRPRSPEFVTTALSQNVVPLRFGNSCKKCTEIRSSLKFEIAKLKKSNAELLREVKKLREHVAGVNEEKVELRSSVSFLQKMYATLLTEHEEAKRKNADLKKVILL